MIASMMKLQVAPPRSFAQEHLWIAHGGFPLLKISKTLSNASSMMLKKVDFLSMVPPNQPKNAQSCWNDLSRAISPNQHILVRASAQERLGIAHGRVPLLKISKSLSNALSLMLNKTDFLRMASPDHPKNAHS